MSSIYEPVAGDALQQCELLTDVVENRALTPAHQHEGETTVQPFLMPRVFVMTNGCDLLFDYEARIAVGGDEKAANPDWEQNYHRIIPHLLLCQVFSKAEIKGLHSNLNTKRLQRVDKNQEERLHHLPAFSMDGGALTVDEAYLDFKKTYAIPTQAIYDALESGSIGRAAVLVGDYRFDLMHRYFGYLSRIGVPETE